MLTVPIPTLCAVALASHALAVVLALALARVFGPRVEHPDPRHYPEFRPQPGSYWENISAETVEVRASFSDTKGVPWVIFSGVGGPHHLPYVWAMPIYQFVEVYSRVPGMAA